ncbi:MAG: hypothetical protein Q9208_008803 [Pyrenodesmia sp. 3 TL-2023]
MKTSKPEYWDAEFRELEYQQLSSPSHIRLFRLLAKDGRAVGYEIITVDMADCPVYKALSYTWGNPLSPNNPENEPYINRKSQILFSNGQSLSIGQNLNTALLRFQQLGIHGDIWVDAICINQRDVKERNAQVAIMGDIYANAEKVIVWLGDEHEDLQAAFYFLDKFVPKLEYLIKSEESQNRKFSYSFGDPRLYDRLKIWISQESFDGLANFLERAWFQRAWTFQEILLARQIDVICGTKYIDWDRFEHLLSMLRWSDWHVILSRRQDASKIERVPGRTILSTMGYRRHILRGGPHEPGRRAYLEQISAGQKPIDLLMGELDGFLFNMRCRRATDLRDHVYALYGVADRLCQKMDIVNPLAAPDYHGSVEQAYTEYCRAILDNSNTLLLLSNIEDRPDESSQFPSWVPNFKDSLRLEGYLFDTVIGLGESDTELFDGSIPFTKCAELLLKLPPRYITGQDRAEVLWRTLIADQAQDQCPAPLAISRAFYEQMLITNSLACLDADVSTIKDAKLAGFGPLAQLATSTLEASRMIPSLPKILKRRDVRAEIAAMRKLERSEQGLNPEQTQRVNKISDDVAIKRARALPFSRELAVLFAVKRLFTTSKGFLGSAPESTREGDQIYLLSGGRVPFVLRPRSDGTYRLVGESYVHGIMQGEAFDREQLVASQVTLV